MCTCVASVHAQVKVFSDWFVVVVTIVLISWTCERCVCVLGEYVTLYQQQRSAMRLRASEREGYIYQLARERLDLQDKLGELQSLVVTLLGERNMLHSYQTSAAVAATTPVAATTNTSVLRAPPSKRQRRTRNAQTHDASADGMPHLIDCLWV